MWLMKVIFPPDFEKVNASLTQVSNVFLLPILAAFLFSLSHY